MSLTEGISCARADLELDIPEKPRLLELTKWSQSVSPEPVDSSLVRAADFDASYG